MSSAHHENSRRGASDFKRGGPGARDQGVADRMDPFARSVDGSGGAIENLA